MDIPPALLDRMELIELSGYTEDEKQHIANEHLISKCLDNNVLKKGELSFDNESVMQLIRYYTREAGVRA